MSKLILFLSSIGTIIKGQHNNKKNIDQINFTTVNINIHMGILNINIKN